MYSNYFSVCDKLGNYETLQFSECVWWHNALGFIMLDVGA